MIVVSKFFFTSRPSRGGKKQLLSLGTALRNTRRDAEDREPGRALFSTWRCLCDACKGPRHAPCSQPPETRCFSPSGTGDKPPPCLAYERRGTWRDSAGVYNPNVCPLAPAPCRSLLTWPLPSRIVVAAAADCERSHTRLKKKRDQLHARIHHRQG